MPYLLDIPGQVSFVLGRAGACTTIGRGEENDVSIDDPSLSRRHGRFELEGQACFFEDLGSRNGSRVNGEPLTARTEVAVGDVLVLGRVPVTIGYLPLRKAEDEPTQLFPLDQVRREFSALESQGGRGLDASLNLLQEISLDLLQDAPILDQIAKILARLHAVIAPRRIVALIRSESGEMVPWVAYPDLVDVIPVSRTAVTSICETRQALLVQDRLQDVRVRDASSLVFTAVRTLMAAPLECEGAIEGLLYAEAGMSREPFSKRDLALLATVAHMLAARVRTSRLLLDREKSRVIEREMEIARQIQGNLLPASDPVTDHFEFLGRAIPSRQVGGDLFGYWRPSDRLLYGAIADVSGKGVGPGLLMACLVAYMNGGTRRNPDTAILATWLSRDLAGHTNSNRFATAFLFRLDPEGNWVEYTNAGHNAAILVRSGGSLERLETQGLPLALFPGSVPYGLAKVELGPGDLLFLYTDGITEAAEPGGEEFGMDRLERVLVPARALPLADLVAQVDQAMATFAQGLPFGDDRTVMVVRRTLPRKAGHAAG